MFEEDLLVTVLGDLPLVFEQSWLSVGVFAMKRNYRVLSKRYMQLYLVRC